MRSCCTNIKCSNIELTSFWSEVFIWPKSQYLNSCIIYTFIIIVFVFVIAIQLLELMQQTNDITDNRWSMRSHDVHEIDQFMVNDQFSNILFSFSFSKETFCINLNFSNHGNWLCLFDNNNFIITSESWQKNITEFYWNTCKCMASFRWSEKEERRPFKQIPEAIKFYIICLNFDDHFT